MNIADLTSVFIEFIKQVEKNVKMRAFLAFFATCLINSMIHDYECKNLFKLL